MSSASTPPLRFGRFVLDFDAERLSRDGQPLALAPRSYAVLAHLAQRAGALVTKDELLDAVWGHQHVSDSVLKVAMNTLRGALGDDARAPQVVETVPRRGYRFIGAALAPVRVAPQGNLPAAGPALVGRDAEAATLAALLERHRLVTLLGPGGVGKTSLALVQAGHGAPADGVWLLRLDTLGDDAHLLPTLARTLSLPAAAEADTAALLRALQPLQLRLVLDSAERHVEAVAALAAALLAGAPGVSLLVTSQRPLNLAAEQRLPLPPLASPPADAAPDAAAFPALQLLLVRVAQQLPGYVAEPAALRDAAAICQALDGLPLALELAAARVPLQGMAGVRARLEDRLNLLTKAPRDAAARHRTLRATLEWSFSLLGAAEQHLLARLSVFDGGFTAAAAEAVAPAHERAATLDHLEALREHSLLERVAAAAAGPPRWRLLDSVRALAAERLAEDAVAAHDAHRGLLQHLLALFARSDEASVQQPLLHWLAPLRTEVGSLRAALRQGWAEPRLQSLALDLFCASSQFRARAGWRADAAQDLPRARALLPQATPLQQARFDLAQALLGAHCALVPPAEALAAAQRAASALSASGHTTAACLAQAVLGALQMRLQVPEAQRVATLNELKALEPAHWPPHARRHRLWLEACLVRDQGDLEGFEDRCVTRIVRARALDDDYDAWISTQALAQVMLVRGRAAGAVPLMQRAVEEMQAQGRLRENTPALALLATLQLSLDGTAATQAVLQRALTALQAENLVWWMADALAWLPAWQGRWRDALRVQAWADALVRERGDKRGPMFNTLRQRFAAWQIEATPLALPDAADLDEISALALVLAAPADGVRQA